MESTKLQVNKVNSPLVIKLKELIKDASHEQLIEWYALFTGFLVLDTLIEKIEFEEALDCIDKHVIVGEFPDKNIPGGLYIFSHGTANFTSNDNTTHYYWQGELFVDIENNHIKLINHHLKMVKPTFDFDEYVESMDGMPQSNLNPLNSKTIIKAHNDSEREPGNEPENEPGPSLNPYLTVGCCLLIALLIVTFVYFSR